MIWVAISSHDRLNFVGLGLKPAARADKQSSVDQCSHKIDFSLYKTKKIPMYVLAGEGEFPMHRSNKSSFVLLN